MLNPENRPTSRIHVFSDGRHRVIPTSEGLHHTKGEKKRKRVDNLNSENKRRNEKKQSTVWNKVRPLYERGLLNAEIEMLTDLSHQQIVRSIGQNKYRPEWNRAKSPRNTNRRIGAWKLRKELNSPLSEDKKRSIEFIKPFVASGLISADISMWKELNKLYGRFNKTLPKSNFDKLRLEIFLMAIRKQEDKKDPRSLETYSLIGRKIDDKWFGTSLCHDETFIGTKNTIFTEAYAQKRLARFVI
jgi:hypothetical protein